MLGGLVVSNDHYPSCAEYPEWAETLHSRYDIVLNLLRYFINLIIFRVISYSWCRDIFHLVVDPLGRAGPEVLDVNVFADGETLPTNFFRVPETLTVAGYIAECLHLKKPSYLATEHQKLFGVSSNLQRCDYHRSASTEEEVRISPDLGFVNQDHSNATRFIAPLLEPVQNYLVNSILTAAEQAGLVVSACSADSGVSVGINRSLSQHLTDISIDGDVINGARLPPEHPQTPPSNEKPLMEENFVTIEDELMALMWNHKQLFDDLCGLYPNNIAQIETFMHANPEVTDVLELIEKIFHL